MSLLNRQRVRCREINREDLAQVAKLLRIGHPDRDLQYWHNALATLSAHNAPSLLPKYGYVLEVEDSLVGVLLTVFAKLPGGVVRCNVSSWYVAPNYRPYGSLLSGRPLKYNLTFLNTSPAPHTLSILEAQGYSQLTSGVFVGTGLLGTTRTSNIHLFPDYPLSCIPKAECKLLLDHSSYGCLCLWSEDGGIPFIFRRRHIFARKIPCAHLIYCRDMDAFSRHAGCISRLLLKRGMPWITVNCNGPVPGLLGRFLQNFRPMYRRGEGGRVGDIAYTEGAMFGM